MLVMAEIIVAVLATAWLVGVVRLKLAGGNLPELEAARKQIKDAWANGQEAPEAALRTMHQLAPNESLAPLSQRA